MRDQPRRSIVLVAMLAVSSLGGWRAPAAPAQPRVATGRIEGTVEISMALTARRPQFRPYSDPGAGGIPAPAPREQSEVRNVVIYLAGDAATLAGTPQQIEAHQHASIAQRDERFMPHVVAIARGGTVDFPNNDDVFHNVYSLSKAAGPKGFDLGRYPKGESRGHTFLRAGTANVFCHIHTDMSAFVLVLDNPFFAMPDENRRFVIDNVPEGEYTIVGWHERITPIVKKIRVVAGQTAVVDYNIPLTQGGGSGRP